MKLLKKTKLVVTALVLGLPITPILAQDGQDAKAMMKVGSTATKIANTIKPGLVKPPIAPKPTNIPKATNVPKIVNSLNTKPNSSTVNTPKGNVLQKVSAFNNNSPHNGKAMGPISQKVAELNLTAKFQNNSPKINSKNGVVNSAIKSLNKTDPSYQKQSSSKKLNLDSGFKNKLNEILGNGNPMQSGNKKQNANKPGKLNANNEASQKLESIFGNGNSSSNKQNLSLNSSSSSSQAFENSDPNIPKAPPLPGSSNTLTQTQNNNTGTPNIPDAPPLPQSAIPPAPPLPDKKPVTTTTSNGGSSQNQLTSKLESGLNKTNSSTSSRKPLNIGGNSVQDQLIKELKAKFNKK